jgi:hypothetical protein
MSVNEFLSAGLGEGSSEGLTATGSPPWIPEAGEYDLFPITVVGGLVSLSNMATAKGNQCSPGNNGD